MKEPSQDSAYMARALQLAERGLYTTKPNPRVGCLLVREGEIVGEGWHIRAGEAHAEINALAQAGDRAEGAETFVTLEPCSHSGRTGPCVEALINAGISRVVAAMKDPNPKVAGKGLEKLRQAGIDVVTGPGASAAQALNAGFCKRMEHGRPLVRVKLAATLDGRTAAADGSSQWITSQPAREDVHRLRARSCAIITGLGTVIADNPRLNPRLDQPVTMPLRVVLDGNGDLTPESSLFTAEGPVLIATLDSVDKKISGFNAETLHAGLPGEEGRVDLGALLDLLAERGCNEVMVEAGADVAGSFLSRNLVDELIVYMAPDVLGSDGRGMFIMPEIRRITDRHSFKIDDVRQFGRDLRIVFQNTSKT